MSKIDAHVPNDIPDPMNYSSVDKMLEESSVDKIGIEKENEPNKKIDIEKNNNEAEQVGPIKEDDVTVIVSKE